MNKLIQFLIVIIIAAVTAWSVAWGERGAAASHKETAYERVMRTGTLRCGYNIWEPIVIKDPTTGAMSGAFVDYMEAIGKNTGLKIEWTTQLDWGHFPEDLRTSKVDAMCAGVWADGRRGKYVVWTTPIWMNQLHAYVRDDDARFTNSLDRLNAPDVSIAVWEGTTNEQLANALYSQAKKATLPALTSATDGMMDVQTKKADAIFVEPGFAAHYNESNPGNHLRRIDAPMPVAVYGETIAVDIHETELLNLLNAATYEIINNGQAKKIAQKYDPKGISFLVSETAVR